jgi:hypothetical protein
MTRRDLRVSVHVGLMCASGHSASLDPGKYPRRAKLQALAVAPALDRRTASSRDVPFTIRR